MEMTEWASVKDRLPEPWVDVLAWCQNKSINSTFKVNECYACIDRFCIWTDGFSPSFRTDRFYGEVLYWMPVPSPTKE